MPKKKPKGPRKAAASRKPIAGVRADAVLGTLLVLALLVVIAWIEGNDSALYLRIVQEDEILEWGTVWAFLGGMGLFLFAAYRQWKAGRGFPWFFLGVAAFCFAVAGEEISWGQRVFGYRPPSYFLENNYQQELNLHNVFDKDLRKSSLRLILLAYGILLPLAALPRSIRGFFSKLGVVAPPWPLIPIFAASLTLYNEYPWDFTGEVVELTMGLGFLFAGLNASHSGREGPSSRTARWTTAAGAFLLVLLLGWANAAISSGQRSGNPETLATARSEIEALRRDFLAMAEADRGKPVTKCGLHKRVFTYVRQYHKEELHGGTFASLTAQGLPEDRAAYFIDPWNSPYWIRHRCSKDRKKIRVFVYSFGPNRRRDSDRWNIFEDDVGAMIFERGQ